MRTLKTRKAGGVCSIQAQMLKWGRLKNGALVEGRVGCALEK